MGEDINGEGGDGSTGISRYVDMSGGSVSLNSDGKTLAIGSRGNSIERIYGYIDGTWTQLVSNLEGENEND